MKTLDMMNFSPNPRPRKRAFRIWGALMVFCLLGGGLGGGYLVHRHTVRDQDHRDYLARMEARIRKMREELDRTKGAAEAQKKQWGPRVEALNNLIKARGETLLEPLNRLERELPEEVTLIRLELENYPQASLVVEAGGQDLASLMRLAGSFPDQNVAVQEPVQGPFPQVITLKRGLRP